MDSTLYILIKGTHTERKGNAPKKSKMLKHDYYKPLTSPVVLNTAQKVNRMVNKLFRSGNIDTMTHKSLTIGLKHPRLPEFYTLTKIHKKIPVGRPIVSGSSGPTERIFSFVDWLLQPIAQKQESYHKDTTHFINCIENTQISDHVKDTSYKHTA